MRPILLASLVALVATALAGYAAPRSKKKAMKLLHIIEQVDGEGSGLDADTVRGIRPLVIVDSKGNFVGAVMRTDANSSGTGAWVVRRLDSTPVQLHVTTPGFDNSERSVSEPIAWFESADCSGLPLVGDAGSVFPNHAGVAGQTAYYGAGVPSSRTVQSVEEDCSAGGTPLPDGACCGSFSPFSDVFQDGVQFDLTTLNLTPPFHADVP